MVTVEGATVTLAVVVNAVVKSEAVVLTVVAVVVGGVVCVDTGVVVIDVVSVVSKRVVVVTVDAGPIVVGATVWGSERVVIVTVADEVAACVRVVLIRCEAAIEVVPKLDRVVASASIVDNTNAEVDCVINDVFVSAEVASNCWLVGPVAEPKSIILDYK